MKTCTKCGEPKPEEAFSEARRICRACRNARKKAWDEEHAAHRKQQQKRRRAAKAKEIAAYNKQWREANRERHKELQKKWRDENAEHRKRYNAANAERDKAQERRYRQENAAKLKAYYEANAERIKQRAKLWNQKHPRKIRELAQLRRARKMESAGKLSVREWLSIIKKFDGRCVCCGDFKGFNGNGLEPDHIYKIGPLGSSTAENIQPLCRRCNIRKGNRHSTDYRKTPFIEKGQQRLFG